MTSNADDKGECSPAGDVVSDVVKEVARRAELRQRLEAEGVLMADEEFIVFVDRTGTKI